MEINAPIVLGGGGTDKPGEFGITINPDSLGVPKKLFEFCQENGYRDVIHFLSVVNGFPTSIAVTLGWSIEEVKVANELMKQHLRGHVPDILLDPSPPREFRVGGARAPERAQWTLGKTAASVRFVNSAERYIQGCQDAVIIGLLTDEINRIKSGEVVLMELRTAEEFILRAKQG